jgi:DNA-binding Xre family transcriptional regulator
MLKLNLTRIFTMRGIEKPYAFLAKRGFHRSVAAHLANNRAKNIKLKHLEVLCRMLNCTPNDLFEFKPDKTDLPGEQLPLRSLERTKPVSELSKIVKQIPLDKMESFGELVEQFKDAS